ncbi:hypothetical protein H2200_008465 [Cladophialophora chaetospira]|uniref:Uracil permease n=1 Tax=Cladophialophora chaetospira TaxID=386627 RepID=A0AA39CGG0_9EURO|nr:hypothetical protein H2200_008465 [Cladophialophora chaetospira]
MLPLNTVLKRLQVPHDAEELPPTALISRDVKPIEPERRTWNGAAMFSLWGLLAFNMANWQLGSSLLSVGLNWWQCFLATLIGHLLAAAMVVIASFPGLHYHISFPVSMRIAWGLFGSIFVVLNRILLSIVWFGVQSWLGGTMTYVCLRAMWPSIDNVPATFPASTGMTLPQFIGFIVFYVIQLPILLLNPKQLRFLVMGSTIIGFIVQLVLLIWACATMKGFGSVLKDESPTTGSLGWSFMYGITVTISSITAGILSVCDFSRFARTPAAGQWPQFLGFLPAWLGNVFGIITVAATQQRFGAQLWSVTGLLVAIQDADQTHGTRAAVWFCGAAFLVSQLALNAAGNSFSGGCDMAALLPRWINIRRGQYLTAILGLAINPWYLLSGASVFLSVMSGYSIFIQPSLGIIVGHYFVLQRQRIRVSDLYHVGDNSIYWYTFGCNWRAFVAWLVGVTSHLPGFLATLNKSITVSAASKNLYTLTSMTSFTFAFATILILSYAFPVRRQREFADSHTRQQARQLCEEFITSSAILRLESAMSLPEPIEEYSEVQKVKE